jgi:hypothetical protein
MLPGIPWAALLALRGPLQKVLHLSLRTERRKMLAGQLALTIAAVFTGAAV